MRWTVVLFLCSVAIGIFGCTKLTEKANAQVAERSVNSLEEQRKYQIINVKEYEVTCFKFDNGVDCIPDYQLNTRKKYEG